MSNRRSAKVMCRNTCFWVTPKQFWKWAREGVVEYVGDYPLTGKYCGSEQDFLVKMGSVILNAACPEHLQEIWQATRRQRQSAGKG